MRTRHIGKTSILFVLSLLCGLGIGEVIARLFLPPPPGYALYSRSKNEAHSSLLKTIADARILHRLAPNAPGHDARGFRNPDNLATADIVAIGDSQTWGINARFDETWPSVLGRQTEFRVYSMSLGGWGPLQYELLAKDAVDMKPRAMLVGLYLGNDIFDCCRQAYETNAYPQYRLRGADYSAALAELHRRLDATDDAGRVDRARRRVEELGVVANLWQRVAERSLVIRTLMVRGLLPGVPSMDELYESEDKAWALQHPEAALPYRRGAVSTVMTYGYRGTAVDLDNPCIQDGVRIVGEVLKALKALETRTGIPVGILVIPTKESVYAVADPDWSALLPAAFSRFLLHEAAIKSAVTEQCRNVGLVCIDAGLRLVEAARAGTVVYKADSDGHPVAEGYRQIAAAGVAALQAMGVAPPSPRVADHAGL